MSNFFLPGIQQLVGGDFNITTFYPEEPYMLSANTAMLIPNTTLPALDDAAFRRAMARVHRHRADRRPTSTAGSCWASNPTGMLPVWDDFVDQAVVDANGFSYNIDEAKQILADAGYADTDGDGFVETPAGEAIDLELITPAGWTDWNSAAEVIVSGLQEAGINATAATPSSQEVDERRNAGDFDLVMNNWNDLSNTPWSYYDYVFRQPIQDVQVNANFQRYENAEAWELVQQVGRTEVTDPAIQEPLSQLQEILLTEMPADPDVVQRPVVAGEQRPLDELANR